MKAWTNTSLRTQDNEGRREWNVQLTTTLSTCFLSVRNRSRRTNNWTPSRERTFSRCQSECWAPPLPSPRIHELYNSVTLTAVVYSEVASPFSYPHPFLTWSLPCIGPSQSNPPSTASGRSLSPFASNTLFSAYRTNRSLSPTFSSSCLSSLVSRCTLDWLTGKPSTLTYNYRNI